MKKYILSIDQGTTSTRAIIFDKAANIVASSQIEITQIHPKNDWVEHDGLEIMESVYSVVKNVLNKSKISLSEVSGVGITNQRETTILWDKATGKPIYNAICWQSKQSLEICEDLISKGYQDLIKEKTGLLINPYFSLSKILWILENVSSARSLLEEGKLLFGTIDSYIAWNLSKGKLHITDVTNASRTMLFNLKSLNWDDEILNIVGLPKSMLPEVRSTSEIYGTISFPNLNGHNEVLLAAIAGDQQAALFGQACYEAGSVKNTYGTGCFMLMNTKEKLVYSNRGLLSTIAWKINDEVEYALEGSVLVAGSAIQWLRDGLRFFKESSECENFIDKSRNSNGVYFVPAFVGLGTPYWDNDARGAIFGITRATTKENIVTATLEAISFQSRDVLEVMVEDANINVKYLKVDGGASINNYLIQHQANILNLKIYRPENLETTALGAAFFAGLATGFWKSKDELKKLSQIEKIFIGNMAEVDKENYYRNWKNAVSATRKFKI